MKNLKESTKKFQILLSTGKCKISDLPEENILWAVEIQFFTRSSIYFILNFAD